MAYLAKSIKLCYTYDVLNRVTKRTKKSLTDNTILSEETFTYDAAGNVTSANGETAQYSLNNRIMVFNGSSVGCDLDGNLNSINFDGGRMNLTYDSKNRLTSAGGHTYTYDAEDVRIRNLCGDVDTTYAYDTNGNLSRLLMKTTNGVTTKYVYGLGLIGEQTGNSFKYYHFDSRGSTVALTGGTGIVTDTFEYDTYGKLTSHVGNNNVIFGYNGRYGVVTDANGLLYMRARYYSPEMRRFVNADILPGGISEAITLNRYAYANGNPVSFVDPFGLKAENPIVKGLRTVGEKVRKVAEYFDTEVRKAFKLNNGGEIASTFEDPDFSVEYRNDINGIGLLENGTILAGNNVTQDDISMLATIARMTAQGYSEDVILKKVNDYNTKLHGKTVIKKNKGLEYYTAFEDITEKLKALFLATEYQYTIRHNSEGISYRIGDIPGLWILFLEDFYHNVRNDGPWDLKQNSEWQNSSLYYFNGELVDSDAPGNIMFGYMGSAYGIPAIVLHGGAGYAQVNAGTASIGWGDTLFDDPIDAANIDRGIRYFETMKK